MSALTPEHLTMLADESGITQEVIEIRGYKTVTTKADLETLGFARSQRNVPALLIPIYNPAGETALYQVRPDSPRIVKGKAVKYETPKGSSMALDVHPFARAKLGDPKTPLFITEGVKKGDSLTSRGLCAVALIGVWNFRGKNEHGGKTVLPDWEHVALNDREVYIVFDSDVMLKLPVHMALARLSAWLKSRAAKVRLIYLPTGEGATKQGVDDYLASGHSVDELLKHATTELRNPPETDDEKQASSRPEIEVNGRWLRDITNDALNALRVSNTPPWLYLRGPVLVRVDTETNIEVLTPTALKGTLDRVADFVKTEYRDSEPVSIPARPPADLAPNILAHPTLDYPRLEGISNVPVFLPGGTLLAKDGFDPDSGLLLKLTGLEALRADMPTDEALDLILCGVYGDFPYAEPNAGQAHTLALLLQPFVRQLIKGPTPFFLIDAPARGTGKGLFSETVSLIVIGSTAPVMALPRDNDETEKRITAALLAAQTLLHLDNLTTLNSTALAAALTSELWQGRRLGKSEMVQLRNDATWLGTGNNVTVTDELARRIIPIRLDAGVERPENRTSFKHKDLPAWVRENRSSLVSACLSLVQAWVDAGMPKGSETLGRYENWAGVLGGILEVAGVQGFLGGRERLYSQADSETRDWGAFCGLWFERYGPRPVTASDLFTIIREHRLLLDLWGGRSETGAFQRVGHALKKRVDRVFNGYIITSAGQDGVTGSAAYRLERPASKTTETTETPKRDREEKEVSGVSGVSKRPQNMPPVGEADTLSWDDLEPTPKPNPSHPNSDASSRAHTYPNLADFKRGILAGELDGVPGPRWDAVNTTNLGAALRRVLDDDKKLEQVLEHLQGATSLR